MLSVNDAIAEILKTVHPRAAQSVALAKGHGLVLAEEVIADIDSPPFDKSAMDGYAIRSADVAEGISQFDCLEELMAGTTATQQVSKGKTIAIMTGAPIPNGADAVVQKEQTQFNAATNQMTLTTKNVPCRLNILQQGMAMKQGEIIFSPGRLLRPQELGALAELGKANLLATPRPNVALLATGNELVEVSQKPGPAQIRNSNETMLAAQVERAGANSLLLGIAKDYVDALKNKVIKGLTSDILLLSGGVSAGQRDLVPSVLQDLGIQKVFHKVALKPGKPVWFGIGKKTNSNENIYVFGLPGNPVGSLVCFELFVRTAIRCLMNFSHPAPKFIVAHLTTDWQCRGHREVFHPACLKKEEGKLFVEPLAWQGSADLQTTKNANSMIHFPAEPTTFTKGNKVNVIEWTSEIS
ncbi:Molybdopterin molybdenumtransferase [hydrothermal vent metagenome]|uniref:Molybdopterin molybdenumtransferase n=1 Tax=hydrothermal vent metagenome TaxID=652676 RepID=A0A3B1DRT8_9ZZZZ